MPVLGVFQETTIRQPLAFCILQRAELATTDNVLYNSISAWCVRHVR